VIGNGHNHHSSSSSIQLNVVTLTNGTGSTTASGAEQGQTGIVQWQKKQELKRRIADIDADILGLKESIKSLNAQLSSKEGQKEGLVKTLHDFEHASYAGARVSTGGSSSKGINYMDGDFDWMRGLMARMKSVFGISDFRLCQRGYVALIFSDVLMVCN
jgi:ATP-dependent DNA helicase Q1